MSISRQLPFETISAIVNYIDNPQGLYQCTLTNTPFYKLANPKLWHAPTDVTNPSYNVIVRGLLHDSRINNLRSLPLGNYIRRLDFIMFPEDHKMNAAIGLLFTYTPLLEIVSIHFTYEDPRTLIPAVPEILPFLCPRLREVSVAGYSVNFLMNLDNCRQLRTLHLGDSFNGYVSGNLGNLRNCPLELLSVEGLTWTAENDIHDLQQLPRLSTLKIICIDEWDTEFLEQLLFLSPQPSTDIAFPRMKTLNIELCWGSGVDTHTLAHILTTYSRLQELEICVNNLSIIQGPVFPHLHSLILLDLGHTSEEAQHSWTNACPALTNFEIRYISR
jgi:hypothetical protein